MTTTNLEQLSRRIEQVIQEHIVASQQAAEGAVARAFAVTGASRRAQPAVPQAATGTRRRPSGEIAALGEKLYRAVCEKPGETMAVLAAEIGMSRGELCRPMAQLKQMGQVRSVGQRHLTRYFPLEGKS